MTGGKRIYSDDKFGYLKYESDWKENSDKRKKFGQALPWLVSLITDSVQLK